MAKKQRDIEDAQIIANFVRTPTIKKVSHRHAAKYAAMADQYPFLECDGLSNVIAYEMEKDGYEPVIKTGKVFFRKVPILFHNWIEVNHERFDYRLRMWFGDEAPHGNILSQEVGYYSYGVCSIPPKEVIEVLKTDPKEEYEQLKALFNEK